MKTSKGRLVVAAILLLGVVVLTYGAWRLFFATPGAEVDLLHDEHETAPGGATMYGVRIENTGGARDTFSATAGDGAPPGVTVAADPVSVARREAGLLLVRVGVPAGMPTGNITVPVAVTSANGYRGLVSVDVAVRPPGNASVAACDDVRVDYIGLHTDGRVFDTSIESVARSEWPKDDAFSVRPSYAPLGVHIPGTGCRPSGPEYISVIKGFSEGLVGMRVGETKLVRIPARDAYGENPNPADRLAGKDLVFQITLRSIR